jgi:HPt (histidine-containing phosphotransfer) domain-containing protein
MDSYISKPIIRSILEEELEQQLTLSMSMGTADDQLLPHEALIEHEHVVVAKAIVDLHRLQDMFGDDHVTQTEMLEFFVLTTSPVIDKLAQAINQLHFSDITSIGHQIKGSCSNLGIVELGMLAAEIERAAKDSNIELAQQLHTTIVDAFARLCDYIQLEKTVS